MNNLLPAKFQPYAKAWVSLLGIIVTTVVTAWPEAPRWVAIVGSVLTAVVVYLTPNGKSDPTGASLGYEPGVGEPLRGGATRLDQD